MARMASRPRIGALIRDGIEHKGLRQWQVAEKLGVSRSAVNAWSNDRAYPASYVIVALEKLLDIKIPRWVPDGDEGTLEFDPEDPRESRIAGWTDLPIVRRQAMIGELRAARRTARKNA